MSIPAATKVEELNVQGTPGIVLRLFTTNTQGQWSPTVQSQQKLFLMFQTVQTRLFLWYLINVS